MYVLLGYYITHYNISPDVRMKVIYPLGIIGLAMADFWSSLCIPVGLMCDNPFAKKSGHQ